MGATPGDTSLKVVDAVIAGGGILMENIPC